MAADVGNSWAQKKQPQSSSAPLTDLSRRMTHPGGKASRFLAALEDEEAVAAAAAASSLSTVGLRTERLGSCQTLF